MLRVDAVGQPTAPKVPACGPVKATTNRAQRTSGRSTRARRTRSGAGGSAPPRRASLRAGSKRTGKVPLKRVSLPFQSITLTL